MLLPPHQTRRRLPLDENGGHTSPVMNDNKLSKYSLGCFSSDHTENNTHGVLINERIYAREMFAEYEIQHASHKHRCDDSSAVPSLHW